MDTLNNVNDKVFKVFHNLIVNRLKIWILKVKKRLGLEPPSKLLVEQYLIEIANNYNVKYEPDQAVMLVSIKINSYMIKILF